MKNLYQSGGRLDYVATADLASGDVVVLENSTTTGFLGIAIHDIATGATGALHVGGGSAEDGVTLAMLSTDTGNEGAKVYWDVGNSRLTTTVGTNVLAGRLAAKKASGETVGRLLLNRH